MDHNPTLYTEKIVY